MMEKQNEPTRVLKMKVLATVLNPGRDGQAYMQARKGFRPPAYESMLVSYS